MFVPRSLLVAALALSPVRVAAAQRIRAAAVAAGDTIVYGRINRMSGPPIIVDDRRGEKTISRPDQLFVCGSKV
jgi:hypothetical protein